MALPAVGHERSVFAGFPGLPCDLYREMTPEGLSDDDLHPIRVWLHGFLSGAVWSSPEMVLEDDSGIVRDFRAIEPEVKAHCAENPGETITSDMLSSFYSDIN